MLQRLSDNGVTLKPDQYLFKVTSVKFLGQIVDQSGIHSDPEKVQDIQDFPSCKDVSEVRSFLGLVNQLGTFGVGIVPSKQPLTRSSMLCLLFLSCHFTHQTCNISALHFSLPAFVVLLYCILLLLLLRTLKGEM